MRYICFHHPTNSVIPSCSVDSESILYGHGPRIDSMSYIHSIKNQAQYMEEEEQQEEKEDLKLNIQLLRVYLNRRVDTILILVRRNI